MPESPKPDNKEKKMGNAIAGHSHLIQNVATPDATNPSKIAPTLLMVTPARLTFTVESSALLPRLFLP